MSEKYLITSRFEDGAQFQFECGEDENILAAALRQDVRLLCQCKKAFCGSCKAECTEGDYEFGERINVQVLPPNEEEDGIVVTCDTFPRSDLVLEFPYTSDRLGLCTVAEISAKVVSVERLSTTVYRLVLQSIDPTNGAPQRFDFEPGQYVEIGLPGTDDTRAFSLANLPNDEGILEFLIRLVPGGRFAAYLEDGAAPGQVLNLRGPLGEFTFVGTNGAHRPVDDFRLHANGTVQAFIGGSTGLAPLVSMLRELARRDYPGECHLFFGMQDSATMFYEQELRELAHAMPGLTLHLALMDPPEGWTGFTGNAVVAFEQWFTASAQRPEVYLCGPAPMVEAARACCTRLGIPAEHVHREEFVASGG
ncbi:hypothetical protein CJ010_10820 [Azoarcus sp. DD4]|uniref:FAD-binding oxidoreductase n=1 Tax=Azoarcus sp. DD4 TaxID=2027405 RepID=UPI00112D8EF0|nr:2Fe-2S iron-sulfur cluster binding domain-containing protein [Azoarcus sp. DD4]QDF96983.1 hypothetical protein CJ010_10820 [Azoarcus sp. DD4]